MLNNVYLFVNANILPLLDECYPQNGGNDRYGTFIAKSSLTLRAMNPRTDKPLDRRIQRTKKLLSDALVSLIIEKGYEAVSIKDIIDRANVGRSTFYAHFENKEQLLVSGHDTFQRLLTDGVRSLVRGSKGVDINFLFLYQHIKEQQQLVRALMRDESGRIVQEQLIEVFAERIARSCGPPARGGADGTMFALTVQAAAAAMGALLVEWIQRGMPFTPEEMAARSESLLIKMTR